MTPPSTDAGASAGVIRPPVLVPRDDSHDRFVTTLKHAGFGVMRGAVTRTRVLPDAAVLAEPRTWQGVDWLVVTSRTTVGLLPQPDTVADCCSSGSNNPPLSGRIRLAAVGKATARALEDAGFPVDFVPSQHSGAGLVAEWPAPGAHVLLPTSALAAPTVAEGLAAAGCAVERIDAYTTEPVDSLPPVLAQSWAALGAVVVTSSSVARALDQLTRDAGLPWTARQRPVALGGPTAATLDELGHPAAAVAPEPTPEAVRDCLLSIL